MASHTQPTHAYYLSMPLPFALLDPPPSFFQRSHAHLGNSGPPPFVLEHFHLLISGSILEFSHILDLFPSVTNLSTCN